MLYADKAKSCDKLSQNNNCIIEEEPEYVTQADAEEMARRLAAQEGIFCGISAGGALVVALRIARQAENATKNRGFV